MKIKNLLVCMALLCAASLPCGCTDGKETEQTERTTLAASVERLDFSAESYALTIEIKSNAKKWIANVADKWCQTDITSGAGDKPLRVSVSANATGGERNTTLTIRAEGAADVVIPISQSAESGGTPVEAQPDEWDGVKRADITYQLLVYSFADSDGDGIGDFRGITERLDYLDAMGVSAIWLSPVHPAASYHGYDVKDYETLNEQYGTEEDFRSLIDAAHEHGIKIYMDYVINHTSKEHPWFRDVLSNDDSPYRDYYVLSENPAADIKAGNIAMIATEGAAGYDAGQWFRAVKSDATEKRKLRFTLRWSANPTLTVEQTDAINNTGAPSDGKYLYHGDPAVCSEFYSAGNDVYTLDVETSSPWGCLVRTSTTSWTAGTKYGADPSSDNRLEWGEPLALISNASGKEPSDILFPGMETLMYHSHFWTDWFVDLNYGAADTCADSPAFKAICSSTHKWIDMGIDGLRLDGAKHVYHNGYSNENPVFWHTFYEEVNSYFRRTHDEDIYMVGEMYDSYNRVAPYYYGLPAFFEFSFWYRLEWALNNSTGCYFASDILSYRDVYAQYRSDYVEATKLTNHDENRAASLLGGSADKAKMAGAVLLTACGSPYVYYGEELGYVGMKDEKGDEYVRNPMKWGDSYTTTFMTKNEAGMASVADVAAQSEDENSILNVYRTFATLRNTYPAMASGVMTPHETYNKDNAQYKQIAAWYRTEGNQRMLVVHNLSAAKTTLVLDDDIDKAVAVLNRIEASSSSGQTTLHMNGWSSAVFLLK